MLIQIKSPRTQVYATGRCFLDLNKHRMRLWQIVVTKPFPIAFVDPE